MKDLERIHQQHVPHHIQTATKISGPGFNAAKSRCLRIAGVFLTFNVIFFLYLAVYNPKAFFIFSFPFSIFNFYLMAKVGIYSNLGIQNFWKNGNRDFYKSYSEKKQQQNSQDVITWEDVIHYVIIPNYREAKGTLEEMINTVAQSNIAKSQIIIVLAMEEREEGATQKAKDLISMFKGKEKNGDSFREMFYTIHPPNLPGEMKGKSSNEAWAAQKVFEHVQRNQFNQDSVVITICDADSYMHPKHFDYLNYKFCTDSERHYRIWQAPMVCYKNYDTTPVPTRMLSMAVSMHEIACLTDRFDHHIPFSTYSLSYKLAHSTGGWDTDVIPEDWHMYIKSFFNTGGRVIVEPIHLPVICYAVESDDWWSSVKERYNQAIRHQWGISEVGYYFYRLYEVLSTSGVRRLDVFRTLALGMKACSLHYFSAMGLFLMTISFALIFSYSYIPSLADTTEAAGVTGSWSMFFRYLNMITILPTMLSIFAHTRMVRYVLGTGAYGNMIWLHALKWAVEFAVLQGIVTLFFATYPSMRAAFLQMLTGSDDFDYKVAAKPVKEEPISIQEEDTSAS